MNRELRTTLYIVLILLVIAGIIFFVYKIRGVIPTIIYGAIIAYILLPITNFLSKKIPRFLASAISMLAFIAILSLVVYFFVPVVVRGINELVQQIPDIYTTINDIFQRIKELFDIDINIGNIEDFFKSITNSLQKRLEEFAGGAVEFTLGKLYLIPSAILSLLLAFFFMKDSPHLYRIVVRNTGISRREVVKTFLNKVNISLRTYFSTLLLTSIFTGCLLGTASYFAGTEYFLLIGILDAILEMVPYVGPTIVFIIGLMTSLFNSLRTAIIFTILFLIIQFVQDNLVLPHFVGERLKITPAIIIIMIAVGGAAFGALGVLIATPLFLIARALIDLVRSEKKPQEEPL